MKFTYNLNTSQNSIQRKGKLSSATKSEQNTNHIKKSYEEVSLSLSVIKLTNKIDMICTYEQSLN